MYQGKFEAKNRPASRGPVPEIQEEQRQAQVKKTARCCGQDMTKLGVSTFQLGEHTFLGGDLDHLLSGSMKMAVFRCEVCGRLKFFDPEWVQ